MRSFKINIYELANKYKEFIYKNTSLAIWSIVSSEGLGKAEVYKSVELIQTFNADTEAESIFKACEWIYNNKNKYSIIKEIK